ncbi:hypothetical protein K435DRAFT_783385 [Dendrothele bispora CBS 962.96]|uniref:Uncharacterized protein n=1 Tax=Dendrothele bispora (strain CBS 962.96) TaxID=1314807 RepID=A0A4S8L983_DENBC|nr:hypothetical protein K435DRAFT_783385 [Dendrothele bispora CBS 962.96]
MASESPSESNTGRGTTSRERAFTIWASSFLALLLTFHPAVLIPVLTSKLCVVEKLRKGKYPTPSRL